MSQSVTIGLVLDFQMAQRIGRGLVQSLHPSRQVCLIDFNRPRDELLATIRQRRPAGLITRWVDGMSEALVDLRLPTAIFSGRATAPHVSTVEVDNTAIGALAAEHLVDRGFRSFAFVGNGSTFSRGRHAEFRARVIAAGMPAPAAFELLPRWEQYFEYAPGDMQLTGWLKRLPKPVALFAAFDKIGFLVDESCRAAGLTVPDDVAILGVNNDELFCTLARPPLSSVRVPWEKVGAELGAALERQLQSARHTRRRARSPSPPVMVRPDGVAVRQSTDLVAIPDPLAARALAYLQKRAHEPITIKDLLRDLALSRRNLEYVFRRHLHRTPREELLRVRMERAKALLIDTDLPMALVAERCGFNYAERFSVAFKRVTGATPNAFRRQYRAPA